MKRHRQRGFLLNPYRFGGGGGGTDPLYSHVALHVVGNGVSISDVSQNGIALDVGAGVGQSSADLPGGMVFNGAADSRIKTPASGLLSLGTGDFCIDGFLRTTVTGSHQTILDTRGSSVQGVGLYAGETGKFLYTNNSISLIDSSVNFPLTAFHWAVERVSGVVTVYLNGVARGSATDSRTLGASPEYVIGQNYIGSQPLTGTASDIRVTLVARFMGNFTPPTPPLPTS